MQKPVCTLGLFALITACGPGTGQTEGTTSGTTGSTTGSTGATTEDTPTTTQGSSSTSVSTGSTADPSATEVTATTTVETTSTTAVDPTSTSTSDTTGPVDDTTSTSTGDTEDPPETTGGEVCGVVPEAMVAWNLVVPPALAGLDIDADCDVVGATKMGPETTLDLSCSIGGDPTPIAVVYSVAPEIQNPWAEDLEVHLAYRSEQPFWINEWLAITEGDNILHLGAIRASALAPADTTTQEFFNKSITLKFQCPALPDRCGMREPIALDFFVLVDGEPATLAVKSGEHTSFGDAGFKSDEFFVEHASRLLDPIECDDAPATWIDAMLLIGDKS